MLFGGSALPQEARELRRMRMRLRREARLAHEQAQRRARAAAADEAAKQHVRDAAAERERTRAQRVAAAAQKLEQVCLRGGVVVCWVSTARISEQDIIF